MLYDLSMNSSLSMYLLFTLNKSINTIANTIRNVKFLPINLYDLSVANNNIPIIIALITSLLKIFCLSSKIILKISGPYAFE